MSNIIIVINHLDDNMNDGVNNYNNYNNYNLNNNNYNLNNNNYNLNNNNRNYWNEIIYMIHEMNVNEMIVPVHNRDYLLGVLGVLSGASSESLTACVETPVEIFERLKINVSKADDDKVQTQAQEEKKEDCCSVCKEDYVHGDEVVTTGCKHLFHACCLATWVNIKQTCPNCREPIVNLFL